jgi:hypothetical protein
MGQECPMVGSVYGRHIALIIYGEKIAHWMETMLIALSVESHLLQMKKG